MKWLLILFTIFKPFFSGGQHEMPNPVAEIKDMIKANALKVMLSFGAISALATIFAAGIIMIAVDVGAQYDQNATVYFSAMILLGITLALLPVIIGAIALNRYDNDDDEKKEAKRPVLTNVGTAHPLQDALAMLIADFVKEREMKRAQEETSVRAHYPAEERHHETKTRATDSRVPGADDFRH